MPNSVKMIMTSTVAIAMLAYLASIVTAPTIAYSKQDISLPYKDRAAIKLGQTIYKDNCASCHGTNLEGQIGWQTEIVDGRRLAPPHDETGHTWHHPDELLYNMTKYGFAEMLGKKYPNNMPVYEDILSDGELLAVLGYIKSTWPEKIKAIHNKINQSYASNKNS